MTELYETDKIAQIINDAHTIVVVQADNPDADSLGSALALETILSDLGKQVYLYCGVETPGYLRYMAGWDRISNELPNKFDASIIVDASTMTLLEKLAQSGHQGWLASKPCIVLDHHESVENLIPFATETINDFKRASAGELIYIISQQLGWTMSQAAQEFLMLSILGDTQGLSNDLASAKTYQIMSEMVEAGISRPKLEEARRELSKMPAVIYKYKARLIERTEFNVDKSIVYVNVTQQEIIDYSPLYNPGPLVQADMLQIIGVKVAIVFKTYDDGKITAAIRCSAGFGIAAELAEHFGGGGHAYASGFKITDKRSFQNIKDECLQLAGQLLAKI